MSAPDAITIDGVTITRQQWELIKYYKHRRPLATSTWEHFVAANSKPEHYDGEPCTLPIVFADFKLAEGLQFEYTGRKTNSRGNRTWLVYKGEIMYGYDDTDWYWELRAIPIQPAPKYKVGDWVVENYSNAKPYQIGETKYTDRQLRLATREDFMVEFGGVKVWMQHYDNGNTLLIAEKDGKKVYCIRLYDWQVTAYRAAGVMEMPEQFWK